MLRFIPDDWLQALLRPFIMADPVVGIYFEDAAPDWRFAAFIILALIAWLARGASKPLTWPHKLAAAGLFLHLYVWTFVIGNGRYFMSGLLLIGPLVVAAAARLPLNTHRQWLLVGGIVAIQVVAVHDAFVRDIWGLARWEAGPLPMSDTPVRHKPAVFLTISSVSYSVLVPHFDPRSRWSNIDGQRAILPGTPEYPRLQAMLTSPLPKYVVVPTLNAASTGAMQPRGALRHFMSTSLARHSLALADVACEAVMTPLGLAANPNNEDTSHRGFWICPLRAADKTASVEPVDDSFSHRALDVFDRVEQRCPQFFPPGNGAQAEEQQFFVRQYAQSDMRLYVHRKDRVFYSYWRAPDSIWLGTTADVLAGKFTIDCTRMPGRYRLPWQR